MFTLNIITCLIFAKFTQILAQESFIDFDGTNDYIEWADDANWGDLGSLDSPGEDYSFGWTLGSEWEGGTFDDVALFSRDEVNAYTMYATPTTAPTAYTGLGWTGNDGSIASGGAGALNDYHFGAGDSVQWNCRVSDYTCTVYHNGNLVESASMAALATKPRTSGVVRFGYPVTPSSGTMYYYGGMVSNIWFARNIELTDGTVSSDLSQELDPSLGSYWDDISSFFDLGSDTYPAVVDVKGNVTDGTFTNGAISNFIQEIAEPYIDFDGIDDYIEWSDEDAWGPLGGLNNTNYSFGFTFGEDWPTTDFTLLTMFSRDNLNSYQYGSKSVAPIISYFGYSLNDTVTDDAVGVNTPNDMAIFENDSIQFNFDSGAMEVSIYLNGIYMDSFSCTNMDVYERTSGVVRFGHAVHDPDDASITRVNWLGKLTNLWYSNDTHFDDGQISEDLSMNTDISGESYYSSITAHFNLGADTYPSVVDLKGSVSNGTFTNGDSSDFGVLRITLPPTLSPSVSPTLSPTKAPTTPTPEPTASPTKAPTTPEPTVSPSKNPTKSPSESPSESPTSAPTTSPTPAPTPVPDLAQVCDDPVINCNPREVSFAYLTQKAVTLTADGGTEVGGVVYDQAIQYNAEVTWSFNQNIKVCEISSSYALNCSNTRLWLKGTIVDSYEVVEDSTLECCKFQTYGAFTNAQLIDANENMFLLFKDTLDTNQNVIVMYDDDSYVVSADDAQLFLYHLEDSTTVTAGTNEIIITLTANEVNHTNNPSFNDTGCDDLDTSLATIDIGGCSIVRDSKPSANEFRYTLQSTLYETCSVTSSFTNSDEIQYETYIQLENEDGNGCFMFQPGNDYQPLDIFLSQDITGGVGEETIQNVGVSVTNITSHRCLPYTDYVLDHAKVRFTLQFVLNGTDITFDGTPYLDQVSNTLSVVSKDCVDQGDYVTCDVILETSQCERIYKNTAETGCVFDKNDRYVIYDLDITETGNDAYNGTKSHNIANIDTIADITTFDLADCTTPDFITLVDVTDTYDGILAIQNIPTADWDTPAEVTLRDELVMRIGISDALDFSTIDLQIKSIQFTLTDVVEDTELVQLSFSVQDKLNLMGFSSNNYYEDAHFCRYYNDDESCSRFYKTGTDRTNTFVESTLLGRISDICQTGVDTTRFDFFSFDPDTWLRGITAPVIRVDYTVVAKLEVCNGTIEARRLGELQNVNIHTENVPQYSEEDTVIQYVELSDQFVIGANENITQINDDTTKEDKYTYSILVFFIIGLLERVWLMYDKEYSQWIALVGDDLWKKIVLDFLLGLVFVSIIYVISFQTATIDKFYEESALSLTLLLVFHALWCFIVILSFKVSISLIRTILKWHAVLFNILMAVAAIMYTYYLSDALDTPERNATIAFASFIDIFLIIYSSLWNYEYINDYTFSYEQL